MTKKLTAEDLANLYLLNLSHELKGDVVAAAIKDAYLDGYKESQKQSLPLDQQSTDTLIELVRQLTQLIAAGDGFYASAAEALKKIAIEIDRRCNQGVPF